MFVRAIGQIWDCLARFIPPVEFLDSFDERSLLLLKKLDIFFAVCSIVRSALLGIYANGIVEATSITLALAVALRLTSVE